MIGIDFGATYLDIAVLERKRLIRSYSIKVTDYSPAFLEKILRKEFIHPRSLSMTGINRKKSEISVVLKKNPKIQSLGRSFKLKTIDEIASIAAGAKFLSKKHEFIAVNVGTGTPIIHVFQNKHRHIAGTGIGGGMLDGFARLLLDADVSLLEALAKKGSDSLDLRIGDLLGANLGKLPKDTTASNFGKVRSSRGINRSDIAKSLLKLEAETLGVIAHLAAKSCGCNQIVFTGRVVDENRYLRERIAATLKLFGGKAVFPKNSKYCTAIGAALLGAKN